MEHLGYRIGGVASRHKLAMVPLSEVAERVRG
jgi:hypothetical protein